MASAGSQPAPRHQATGAWSSCYRSSALCAGANKSEASVAARHLTREFLPLLYCSCVAPLKPRKTEILLSLLSWRTRTSVYDGSLAGGTLAVIHRRKHLEIAAENLLTLHTALGCSYVKALQLLDGDASRRSTKPTRTLYAQMEGCFEVGCLGINRSAPYGHRHQHTRDKRGWACASTDCGDDLPGLT